MEEMSGCCRGVRQWGVSLWSIDGWIDRYCFIYTIYLALGGFMREKREEGEGEGRSVGPLWSGPSANFYYYYFNYGGE